ncbi:M64 family metallopeptidase [Sediminitomix flava]|uniref:IgA peptidase n=1 Tax=Sediminitomix flava TaxID=379075 RepID=A0A315ZG88_SEDFL|nr:M64 family metallopeptidase [Sediminitomix flava]PWJ43764.1 IgA peptidase [Sediminitomix flava]
MYLSILTFLLQIILPFNDLFTGQTCRMDVMHGGDRNTEWVALDEFRIEKEWAGTRTNLTNDLNLGTYRIQLIHKKDSSLIFSQGINGIFGEWQTTAEASLMQRAFHESFRFPEPKESVKVLIQKRDSLNNFETLTSFDLDPKHWRVNRENVYEKGLLKDIHISGNADKKLDILILSEGYQEEDLYKFFEDANRMSSALFKEEPFKSRKEDINIRALGIQSVESGISNPRAKEQVNSAFDLHFNSLGSDRYVLTYSNKKIREAIAHVPYDALIIVANEKKYGGAGLYNLWATVTSDNKLSDYVFVHELGHSLAGLGDEYYTSSVAYEIEPPKVEPWEPNLTALLSDTLKWAALVDEDTPIPTPWKKAEFDTFEENYPPMPSVLSTLEILDYMDEKGEKKQLLLQSSLYYDKVGAFEGGGYLSEKIYRPQVDCIMHTQNDVGFCKVCVHHLNKILDYYSEK